MKIHTVFVTYNRLELTKQAIQSYLDTVTVPFTMAVVDNASTDGTQDWLMTEPPCSTIVLGKRNRYPGFATNVGFRVAPADATHLQRADNDFIFLPGWSEHVQECWAEDDQLGQLGLRTAEEEMGAVVNVGGNMMLRRDVWDAGIRYDERPWHEYPKGCTEDTYLSPAVAAAGWHWSRVKQPCIRGISDERLDDPYYVNTWAERGILRDVRARLRPRLK